MTRSRRRAVPATTTRPVTEELAELRAAAAELHDLGHITELLGWDQETMMPARGVTWRGYQQSTLSGIIHERLTAPRLGDLLARLAEAAAAGGSPLSDADRGLIREMVRAHDRAVKLPTRLVKELAEATTQAVATWQRARAESSWATFEDELTRVRGLE